MGAGHYILRFYELLCEFAEGLPGYSLVLGRPSPGSLVMYFGIHGMGTAVLLFLYQGPERLYSGKISCKVQRSSGRKPFSYMCILHQL